MDANTVIEKFPKHIPPKIATLTERANIQFSFNTVFNPLFPYNPAL